VLNAGLAYTFSLLGLTQTTASMSVVTIVRLQQRPARAMPAPHTS